MHGTDSFACALEETEHFFLGEVGAVYQVGVDCILEVPFLFETVRRIGSLVVFE